MQVEGLALGDLETNCFIVSDGRGGPLLVIDPADDARDLIAAVGSRTVESIVLTHGHFDHLRAAAALKRETGAPLAIHAADAGAIGSPATSGGTMFGYDHEPVSAERELEEGDVVSVGNVRLRVLHTPGHTPGSICLLSSAEGTVPQLFAGDTLFAGSVGRTDFPGGDPLVLSRSIREKLAPLADETVVHPGHGPDTTIGYERRVNPFWPRDAGPGGSGVR